MSNESPFSRTAGTAPLPLLLALAATACATGFGAAPTAWAAGGPLSWDECVREVTAGNPSLLSARAAVEAAREQVRSARGAFLPSVTLNLGGAQGASAGSDLTATNYTANLQLNETLFSGLSTLGAVRQAEASERTQLANLDAARARASSDLKTAFVGLNFAQKSLSLARDIINRREENLKNVELRFENGTENKGSVLLSRAYLNDAQLSFLQAQNARDVASRQLAQVLGRAGKGTFAGPPEPGAAPDSPDMGDERLEVSGSVPTVDPVAQTPDLRRIAAATPEHAQAVAQQDSADAAVTVARAGFFPTLSVFAAAGRQGPTFFPDQPSWQAGVNLSYNLFSGGRDFFATRATGDLLAAAMANLDATDESLLTRLRQAYASWVESVQRVKVDEAYLEASSVREAIGRAKYNNGLLSFEDWDLIENDLISRQRNALQSARDRVINEAAWELLQGKGVVP